jgi:hypothetical protein
VGLGSGPSSGSYTSWALVDLPDLAKTKLKPELSVQF